ncbi:alpha,alpha-trehalose phosphorylase [Geothermobacter ehrlichii]|uniref:Alpha,alpha-trehalose phosphorylase n=1 Tax=Geothermobacter ehrlichii TaxID=213224 RepID=A0A5D3WIG6_9BACT|nr:glycosyl hydrolase family 65 protein [Geothermobacter ehrlichii]TYO95845.1 alpha,alpha-trehalose phosphorylase [Geothermobacter ehrlichii]
MIRHETLNPPQHLYPINEWKIIETAYYEPFLAQTETLFAIGNGYVGMRGNYEEGRPCFQNGTFINGFHETWPIVYGEKAYGFAKTGQTMLNVTDAKQIKLYVDDEPFFLPTASLQLYERVLDMRAGTLDREILWETASGKRVLIESRRLVSLQHRHVAAISYQVTVLNAEAPVVISSKISGNQTNQVGEEDPRQARGFSHQVMIPQVHRNRDWRLLLAHRVANSGMTIACGVDHQLITDCQYEAKAERFDEGSKVVFCVDARPGQPIQLFKFITYHSSRSAPCEELCERAERTLDRSMRDGFDSLLKGQRSFLDDFWSRSDVEVEGDPALHHRPPGELQQALRWNLFQILQASARAEGTGIPAKGLTGQTYEGHYFWDTEIYVLPFLTYTAPRVARNLLKFRHSMLDRARQRAREVNQKGALFPWRTINGEEASAYYAAGTAQYHINADIVYALKKYVEASGDISLLYNEGAEILVETARLWYDLGFFNPRLNGQFCIHGVTGPDEYTTVVNNNTYTNLMARLNLLYAAETVTHMRQEAPDYYATLVHRTGLRDEEIADWAEAAAKMYIPYDEETGIHPQDDNFLDREIWDLASTPKDKFPLLLYHHPLVIYRHQVIKQADIVLAMFLLGSEFSPEEKRRNFTYYDPLTTGDSSLSACIQSIVAAEIGDMEKALHYARYAILMDLADVGGNVRDGCHIASMGGTWMVMVYGFAGMRDEQGEITFRPHLPPAIRRLRFHLQVRGQQLTVEMDHEEVIYLLRDGRSLDIRHCSQAVTLIPGQPVRLPIGMEDCLDKERATGGR